MLNTEFKLMISEFIILISESRAPDAELRMMKKTETVLRTHEPGQVLSFLAPCFFAPCFGWLLLCLFAGAQRLTGGAALRAAFGGAARRFAPLQRAALRAAALGIAL